ncbi:MAG: DUF4649 family protein [Lactobacillales bacterium]|jgi:hypothetical protein|nr:DUF4649 family protein [Lactobacillales bacterium]
MLIIEYKEVNGDVQTKEYKNVDEFLTLQMREVPNIQDHLSVVKATIDGKELDFSGNVGELFFKLNSGKYDFK